MDILLFFVDFFKEILLLVIQLEFVGYYIASLVGLMSFVIIFKYLFKGKKE